MPTSPHHVRRQILKRTDNYIESIGRTDMATLSDVFDAPEGKGTVLRLILGASTEMPLRALSYIESAARVAEFLPNEQLQVIFANHVGSRINGLSLEQVQQQARQCAALGRLLVAAFHPQLASKVVFAEDRPTTAADLIRPALETVLNNGTKAMATLRQRGQAHDGNAHDYTAHHVVYQDTTLLSLTKLHDSEPDAVEPARIVSIGCQKEMEFYAARMAVRSQLEDMELLPTAQLFTRHVTPPYFMSRGGEQSMDDALTNGVDLTMCTDRASRRDMLHFANVIGLTEILQ